MKRKVYMGEWSSMGIKFIGATVYLDKQNIVNKVSLGSDDIEYVFDFKTQIYKLFYRDTLILHGKKDILNLANEMKKIYKNYLLQKINLEK